MVGMRAARPRGRAATQVDDSSSSARGGGGSSPDGATGSGAGALAAGSGAVPPLSSEGRRRRRAPPRRARRRRPRIFRSAAVVSSSAAIRARASSIVRHPSGSMSAAWLRSSSSRAGSLNRSPIRVWISAYRARSLASPSSSVTANATCRSGSLVGSTSTSTGLGVRLVALLSASAASSDCAGALVPVATRPTRGRGRRGGHLQNLVPIESQLGVVLLYRPDDVRRERGAPHLHTGRTAKPVEHAQLRRTITTPEGVAQVGALVSARVAGKS